MIAAFYTLSLKLTSDVVCICNITVEVVGVGRTSAAAVKSREAFFAFFLRIDIAALEFITDLRILDPVIYIAH